MNRKIIISLLLVICIISACFTGCSSQKEAEPAADLLEIVGIRKDVATEEDIAVFKKTFETETAYLLSLQLDNGAIPMTTTDNGTVTMNPYFADFAALALLDSGDKYAAEVKAYMDWHFDHLNTEETDYNGVDATIYDYKITVVNGKVTEENISTAEDGRKIYDSTDSYGATFLMVLTKYYEKTGDKEYIIAHKDEMARIVKSMFTTLHKGLAYARPDYEVKYLMDNCEVYEGALMAADLFREVIIPVDSSFNEVITTCETNAEIILNSIENILWKESENRYVTAIFKNGRNAHDFSWNSFYPSVSAQVFPIIHGVIGADTKRANTLYDKFCEAFAWEKHEIDSDFSWGSNVLAAAYMNDVGRTVTYMETYAERYAEHQYPLYNADAARVCMAAYMMLERHSS